MKYALTDDTKVVDGVTVYRIKALVDFGNTLAGMRGGFVESESNLSQKGSCWIFDDAIALGNAVVDQDAQLRDVAMVSGNAEVFGSALIKNEVIVDGYSQVSGNAVIGGMARISGHARVYGNTKVIGKALVSDNVRVFGNAQVTDSCTILGKASVHGEAWVGGSASVTGCSDVTQEALLNVINVQGPLHNTTIMDNHMTVGCLTLPINEWKKCDDEAVIQSFEGECGDHPATRLQDWVTWKPVLLHIAEASNRGVNNVDKS